MQPSDWRNSGPSVRRASLFSWCVIVSVLRGLHGKIHPEIYLNSQRVGILGMQEHHHHHRRRHRRRSLQAGVPGYPPGVSPKKPTNTPGAFKPSPCPPLSLPVTPVQRCCLYLILFRPGDARRTRRCLDSGLAVIQTFAPTDTTCTDLVRGKLFVGACLLLVC